MSAADIINSFGVTLILLAFCLLTLKKIDMQNIYYNLLNLVGSGLACYGSYMMRSVPFIVLEASWCLVSLYSLFKKRY